MSSATKAQTTTTKSAIKFQPGQPVRLADHEPVTGPDVKPVPFYDYYRNLTGKVAKVFDDGTVSVTIDRAGLPVEIRKRHEDCEQRDRDKWLDRLSEEERNRLTAAQKQFSYRYTILVGAADLTELSGSPAKEANSAPKSSAPGEPKQKAASQSVEPSEPRRQSLEEIEAAEQRHLDDILNRAKEA